jgi:hypothetical protein
MRQISGRALRRGRHDKGPSWQPEGVVTSIDASGATILLHIRSGTYLKLGSSAARIIQLLSQDPDLDHAASALSEWYGISLERAREDVVQLVQTISTISAPREGKGRIPTLTGTRAVVASWRRRPWRFRFTIIKVTAAVVVIELGLKVFDVHRLAGWLRVPLSTAVSEPPPIGPDKLDSLSDSERQSYWAVRWVMERWLYDGTCLRRALTLGWFIRRHHPVLRLGMLNDGSAIAHAWLEAGGVAFDAQAVTSAFASGTLGVHLSEWPAADSGFPSVSNDDN